jgi:hypothetical protein
MTLIALVCLFAFSSMPVAHAATTDSQHSGNGGAQATAGQAMRLATGGTALGRGSVDLLNNKFGTCRWVDNNSAIDYFLPDGDSAGWSSFISNRPVGVVLDRCCLAQNVTLTSSDGRTAADNLINGRNRAGHINYMDTAVVTFPMSRQDCTTHCNGTRTCNTTTWTETVSQVHTCAVGGWNGGVVTRSAAPAVNAPAYQACPLTSGPWTVGPWGACSATACGTSGTQTRSVTCNFDGCTGAQPLTVQSCNAPACGWTYSWQAGAWSACSESCGGGTKTRSVVCGRNDGTVAGPANCTTPKPAISAACNAEACPPTRCGLNEAHDSSGECQPLSSVAIVNGAALNALFWPFTRAGGADTPDSVADSALKMCASVGLNALHDFGGFGYGNRKGGDCGDSDSDFVNWQFRGNINNASSVLNMSNYAVNWSKGSDTNCMGYMQRALCSGPNYLIPTFTTPVANVTTAGEAALPDGGEWCPDDLDLRTAYANTKYFATASQNYPAAPGSQKFTTASAKDPAGWNAMLAKRELNCYQRTRDDFCVRTGWGVSCADVGFTSFCWPVPVCEQYEKRFNLRKVETTLHTN